MSHHKSNRAVEGDPDHGHSRGMPRRVDEDELQARTERDRRAAGLSGGAAEDPEAEYREAREEIDREVGSGELRSGRTGRRSREAFPPSGYEG
ncbi:hypothetical protein ACIP79_39650 [Streptomyces sp. NPDC088747]|uniref:hypothetical protein n=1 Tax=Streptomyces sp. NPDC088747 TaxID=3365886 RepID=UPI00380C980D